MSWSAWGARLNVPSIVSQGLEQVTKLKEDVEKSFDQVVSGTPSSTTTASHHGRGSTGSSSASVSRAPVSAPADLFGHGNAPGPPLTSGTLFSGATAAPPPASSSSSSPSLVSSPPTAPASTSPLISGLVGNSTRDDTMAAATTDFFGSYLPSPSPKETAAVKQPPAEPTITTITTTTASTASPGLEVVGGAPTMPEDHCTTAIAQPIVDGGAAAVDGIDASATDATVNVDAPPPKAPDETEPPIPGSTSSTPDETTCDPVPEVDDQDLEAPSIEVGTASDGAVAAESVSAPVAGPDDEAIGAQSVPEEDVVETDVSPDVDDKTVENRVDNEEGSDEDQQPETPQTSVVPPGGIPTESEEEEGNGLFSTKVTSTEIESLRQSLEQREAQLMATSATIQELHDELDKACQREVTAVERNRFLTEQLELHRQEVMRLTRAVSQLQQSGRDAEVVALQQAVTEKDAKLQALLDEGQALSVKQSQLEQRLRQLRREKNEEEEQKLRAISQVDAIHAQVEDLTMRLKAAEENLKKQTGELRTATTNLDEASKRISRLEEDQIATFSRATTLEEQLRTATDENEKLASELAQLQEASAAHDSLSAQSTEMDATIQYLQQTLRDVEEEAARREEMTRREVTDLKRKWQDAVQRVDALGQSVSEATQPLLRQINALQEDQRARQETWKAAENALMQRLQESTSQRRALEQEVLALQEQQHSVQADLEDARLELERKQAEMIRERERCASLQQKELEARTSRDAMQVEVDEIRERLRGEQEHRQALMARVHEKQQQQQGQAPVASSSADVSRLEEELQQFRQREQTLRHDLEWHQKELRRLRSGSINSSSSSPRPPMLQRKSFDDAGHCSESSSALSQASILQQTLESSSEDSRISAPTSILGISQLQHRLRMREGENRLLRQQLQALESQQSHNAEEIVRLSTRNALLETQSTQFQQTQEELEELRQRQHILLELFGEKEEQVEELQAEVGELKAFYRKQLDTLASHQMTTK